MTDVEKILHEINKAEEEIKCCFILARRKIKNGDDYGAYNYINDAEEAIKKVSEMFR